MIKKIFKYIFLFSFIFIFIYVFFKFCTTDILEDPFGFCIKNIKGDYYLEEFDGLYYIQKGKNRPGGCGYLDGVIDKMKIDHEYIYANVKRSTNELNGIYRINCKNGAIEGPLDIKDQEDFVPTKEMFESLYWFP